MEIREQHRAACGLFCPACNAYIGTTQDPARLDRMALRIDRPAGELRCLGCNSDTVSFYCRSCSLKTCAREKGLTFCGQCDSYPCEDLKAFQAKAPHRKELWESQARIKEAGYDVWYEEMLLHYACKACGTINSAYDARCWKCGAEPSNDFTA
jgi:hypothetical protein